MPSTAAATVPRRTLLVRGSAALVGLAAPRAARCGFTEGAHAVLVDRGFAVGAAIARFCTGPRRA